MVSRKALAPEEVMICGVYRRRLRPYGFADLAGPRVEFTVVGDTVNLAARLESRALQGQVLVGESTWQCVKELVVAGPMPIKGKAEPVSIWLVKGFKT
jgi:class 3 adenylate cyclase